MSILTGVLQEELNRLDRQKEVYEAELLELSEDEQRRTQLNESLRRVAEDRIRLKRALAPIGRKNRDVDMKKANPEQKKALLNAPQNLMRKHALYQRMSTEIESLCENFSPIFNDDEDLQFFKDNLSRRMADIEAKLNEQ